MKESCFAADYDIETKNQALQMVREAENVRLSATEVKKRLQEERTFNQKCRMKQKTHIEQMEANAEK